MKTNTLTTEPAPMKAVPAHPPASGPEKKSGQKPSQNPPPGKSSNSSSRFWHRKTTIIAAFSIAAIMVHLVLRFGFHTTPGIYQFPLLATLVLGGLPLLYDLLRKLLKREFGSDLLGGISIVTSVLLGEYLAGSIIVLMLSGGEALENYALRSASSVLAALAKRMPSVAHRKRDAEILDVALQEVAVGDTLVIYPHDICPVDGVVIEGHGVMDESYLTGEPFQITKTSGSTVISGAINGESALTIRTTQRAADSRYAKIMEVMRESEAKRPQLRRLGDRLGAIYTPVALTVAILAWAISGEAVRFLAVLVIATPCPLLIGIPIAIIGSISLCARRAIIVKSPVVLGADRRVSHRDFRQDRNAHLWRAEADRTTHRPGLRAKGGADSRGESGALLETSAGACHSRGGEGSKNSTPGGHRSGRAAGSGTARHRFQTSVAHHQPQQTDRAKSCGRGSTPAGCRWTRMRGGD